MPRQPFHLVGPSPWPVVSSVGAFGLVVGLSAWFHGIGGWCLSFGVVVVVGTMLQWWRDVVREATFMGCHTSFGMVGLRWGMILFILSEVMFFFSFFWAFFHSSLAPTMDLGCVWPPAGIEAINANAVPLLNTVVLLSSGVSVTWAHRAVIAGVQRELIHALGVTVILGAYFTKLQWMEYVEAPFSVSDSVFGSVFFVATGFHGFHVIIGTCFLMVCFYRSVAFHFSSGHHFGFEAAAWYWHFVDVVWIFLYIFIYRWGS